MELRNRFDVPVDPDEAFAVLTDLDRVARCMPGATLTGREGDDYHGNLRLKVGPLTVGYEGTVTLLASDPAARTATLRGIGRETTGQGGAAASITAVVTPAAAGSSVSVVADLDLQGRAAQFGRGVVGDVAGRVIDQFARNLESTLGPPQPDRTGAAGAGEESPAGTAAAALDVWSVAGGPMARRALPALAALLAGLFLGALIARGRRSPPVPPVWYGPPPWWTGPPGGAGSPR